MGICPSFYGLSLRRYITATASQTQHYLVSTQLKQSNFCASNSRLLTINNLVFNNNDFNTNVIKMC